MWESLVGLNLTGQGGETVHWDRGGVTKRNRRCFAYEAEQQDTLTSNALQSRMDVVISGSCFPKLPEK